MTSLKEDFIDTVDGAMEMPPQYGSRGWWRYYNLRAMIGMIVLPVGFALWFVDGETSVGRVIWWGGIALIVLGAVALISRDHIVQRRIDLTGAPLSDREPY